MYPKTIVQWNLLPAAAVQCLTLDSFKEQIPLSVLQQHMNVIIVFFPTPRMHGT